MTEHIFKIIKVQHAVNKVSSINHQFCPFLLRYLYFAVHIMKVNDFIFEKILKLFMNN